jgi:hypothetical protein
MVDDPDVDAFAVRALSFCGSCATYEYLETVSVSERSVLFKRTLRAALPRLETKLARRSN